MSSTAVTEALASIPPEVIAAARLGRTWPQHWVKFELNKILPPEEGFEEFRRILELPVSLQLQSRPIRSLHAAAVAHAADFREIEPFGEPFVNAPPAVIGAGYHRVLECTTRTSYVASFRDALTRGRSTLVAVDDVMLLDYEGDEYRRIDDELELDSFVFRSEGDAAWVICERDRSRALEVDQAFTLLGPNSFAFGHWIAEYLPKLAVAMGSGVLPPMPVLIDADMARQHRQALELMMPGDTQIIEVQPMQDVHARKLWCAPTLYYAPVLPKINDRFRYDFVAASPKRFASTMQAMLARMMPAIGTTSGDQRIFLARNPATKRQLINQDAIEAIAAQQGFQIVHLETLDFVDQIRLVRSARFVAGPEGSAFFVCFFARSGTRLCILNHPYTELMPTVTALMDALGIESTVLTGPFRREHPDYPYHGDYEISEPAFASFLEEWVGSEATNA